ncbi:MAG: hypothetical protein ACHQ9S_18195 [Candidatus Binatia bacterium]
MAPEPSQTEVVHQALDLAEQIRKDFAPPAEQIPPTQVRRYLYQVAALTICLIVMVLELGLLLWPRSDVVREAPVETIAIYQANPCAQQMNRILGAIDAYRRVKRHLPASLSELVPAYLAVAPLDPASGKPYLYARMGDAVSLTCPNPDRHSMGR